MTLRDILTDLRRPMMPRLPDKPSVATEAASIAKRFDREGTKVSSRDAKILLGRFREAITSDDWGTISAREWRSAPWIWFIGEAPLADQPSFLDHLIRYFRSKPKRSTYKAFIFAYLRDFDPSKPSIRRIAQELAGAARQFEWSWAARHEQVRLFSPGEAPGNIASACLAPLRKPFDVLESLGMGGGKASGGLAAHAWLRAVAMARETFSREAPDLGMVDAVMEWSHGPDGLTYPEPRFRAALAEALLLPWIARRAPEEIKEKVTSFVLKHFNDPRLPMNTKDWIGVSEDAISVMRKWLTGFALEQFFVVVGHVAQEHMWRYRKAFWLAYYNANVIDDGWVLFGLEASYYARDAFDKTQSYGNLLKGSGVLSNHSVLLMRIGKLTIADWSHNGRCHIWRDGKMEAPKLYQPRYGRDDLIGNSDNGGQAHYGSEQGTWQRQIEAYIRKETGIRLYSRDYMPVAGRK